MTHIALEMHWIIVCSSLPFTARNNICLPRPAVLGPLTSWNRFLFQQEVYKMLLVRAGDFSLLQVNSLSVQQTQAWVWPTAIWLTSLFCQIPSRHIEVFHHLASFYLAMITLPPATNQWFLNFSFSLSELCSFIPPRVLLPGRTFLCLSNSCLSSKTPLYYHSLCGTGRAADFGLTAYWTLLGHKPYHDEFNLIIGLSYEIKSSSSAGTEAEKCLYPQHRKGSEKMFTECMPGTVADWWTMVGTLAQKSNPFLEKQKESMVPARHWVPSQIKTPASSDS